MLCLGARSFPLSVTANGDLRPSAPLETRERSKSEILPRTPSQGSDHLQPAELDRTKSSSAQGLVGQVLNSEGLPVDDGDTIVRVVEQEIADAFDISTDQLNDAAERLLSELEATLGDEEDGQQEAETPAVKADEESDSDSPSSFWREGLKGIPDTCIVITDL